MSCWARLGETARAVRHYEELTELLREQVGVRPGRGNHRVVPAADGYFLKAHPDRLPAVTPSPRISPRAPGAALPHSLHGRLKDRQRR